MICRCARLARSLTDRKRNNGEVIPTFLRCVKTFAKIWRYGIVVVSLQHQNPQASQRCSNRGSFYFYTSMSIQFDKTYTHPFDIIALLKSRGLNIGDSGRAEHYIRNIGYYRLSAYLYPLLQMPKEAHRYKAVFISWMTIITLTRNTCCHHARVWNKENPITPMIAKKLSRPWVSPSVSPNRTFFDICIIKWFVDIVSPNNDMKGHLQQLLADYPMIDIKAMGFPANWQEEPLWKE